MDEYLLDITKGQQICIRKISPHCGCWRCKTKKRGKVKNSSLSRFSKILFWFCKWINGADI